MDAKLWPHEWICVVVILAFIASLTLFSIRHPPAQLPLIQDIPADHMLVYVKGAIVGPSEISLPIGSTVKELVPLIHLSEDADLEAIKLEKKLRNGQVVQIPFKFFTITVKGAIAEPGYVKIPADTTISQLPNYIRLKETADLSFFKKKRKIKNNETILVPFK